jgi:hypothetical protein
MERAFLIFLLALVPASALASVRCDQIGVALYGENSYPRTVRTGAKKGQVVIERFFHPLEPEFTIHSTVWKRVYLKLPLALRKKWASFTVKTEASARGAEANPVTISNGPFALKVVENQRYLLEGAIFSNLIPAPEHFPGQLKISVEQSQSVLCEQTIELLSGGD